MRQTGRPAVWQMVAAAVTVLVAACATSTGGDPTTTGGVSPAVALMDVSLAQSCEEVADIVMAAAQLALDLIDSRGVDEEPPQTQGTAEGLDLFGLTAQAFERTDLPDCDMESLEWLLCDRNPGLVAYGPAGEEFKEFWYAPDHCEESLSPRDNG